MYSMVFHYEQDGGLVYLPLGFVPDYVKLIDYHTDTNIKVYEWFERMEDDQASGKQEGISFTEGVTANLADAGGIAAFSTSTTLPTVTEWTSAVSTAATARTATAHGTYIKGTTSATDDTGSTVDRSAIFECVTAGTSSGTEPAYPSYKGGQVTDGTVVFERVDDDCIIRNIGYEGIRVAAALQTDGQEMYGLAIKTDSSMDFGDVAGWTDGVKGA
jgi:hypothetical protein